MRHRILLAALLAGSMFSPALAQEVEATVAAAEQTQAVVQRVAVAQEDQREDRMARGDRSWRPGGENGGQRGVNMPDRNEPRRQDWQQRQQPAPQARVQPQVQAQPQIQPRPDWSGRREPPVIMAAPPASTDENRGWRGNNGGWNRDQTRTPPVTAGNDWRRGDRDRDGTPNWRDRDRDNDGVRNNRDWDRNNNGQIDGRWDRNRDGVVDRRWDHNRDGTRDNNWRYNNQRWGHQNWGNNQNWSRDWRNDRRYDWQRYRTTNRDLFRQPRYYSPYGNNYGYQRFGIGIYLESIFFGSRYRINDPWRYRLPDSQWPYEWTRYYDDVLLVDTRNGYVVDVIYGFFW